MIGGSSPGRGYRNFSHHRVQTGSGTHPASYPVGTKRSFPGVKRPGREADHSLPSSTAFTTWCRVKNTGTTLPLPFIQQWFQSTVCLYDLPLCITKHHARNMNLFAWLSTTAWRRMGGGGSDIRVFTPNQLGRICRCLYVIGADV
jgi:hypothetical protein